MCVPAAVRWWACMAFLVEDDHISLWHDCVWDRERSIICTPTTHTRESIPPESPTTTTTTNRVSFTLAFEICAICCRATTAMVRGAKGVRKDAEGIFRGPLC
jgi:hypothetical protein